MMGASEIKSDDKFEKTHPCSGGIRRAGQDLPCSPKETVKGHIRLLRGTLTAHRQNLFPRALSSRISSAAGPCLTRQWQSLKQPERRKKPSQEREQTTKLHTATTIGD